ncbi:MAG: hypothetical protein KDI41_04040 [Pseudomonadales bacterium]|jgi:hypothetical protein|uniref:hypothetical protein n=1 Tax=Pseudomonas TaxID=286 RepID=UPI001923F57E|nr:MULTISPECIES: hypothetical protein [Pseudomonas]MCB1653134.1 hypothetical protein [Pseudomonadales bacterium]MCH4869632.1 hypothetical protein [Pseudomonas sp. TMW22089]
MMRSLWSSSRLLISSVLTGSLLLGGCASTGSSMVDPRLTQSSDAQFFSKSGYQACAMGVGTGVLACVLADSGNKTVCMIAAGVTACGVAMGANYYLDQRRSEYSNTSERLQKYNSDVQLDTQKVVSRTATAQQVIKDDQAQIAQIKRDLASKKIDQAQAKKQIAMVDGNIAQLRQELDNMRVKVKGYNDVVQAERAQGNAPELKQIDANISKMNEKVASLQKEVDGLYSQRSAITLG